MKTIIKPMILNRTDFNGPEPPVYDECDCACPDNGFSFRLTSDNTNVLLHSPRLHLGELTQDHTLLFNPLRDNGVIVLNQDALRIWKLFKNPQKTDTVIENFEFDIKASVDKMLALGILEAVGSHVEVSKGVPRTLSVWLHVNNECNLRCDYCYINKTSDKMDPSIGYASVDAVLRSAIHGNFKRVKMKFAGGEATLNLKMVFALDQYARQQAFEKEVEYESVVLSNGVALREGDIKEMIDRGIRLMVSLDGIGEAHDQQRKFVNGKGSFVWVNRTLDRLAALELSPFISITVTDRSTDSLPETVRYVLDRGLPFNINFFRDNDCAVNFNDLHLRDDKIIASMKEAFAVIEANIPSFSLLGAIVDRSSFGQAHEKACGVGESYIVIDHRGKIAKCHMEIEKPITDVFADDPLSFIRLDSLGIQNLSVDEKEGCRDCEWRYWCAGGCPLLTFKETGRYDIKSPYCRIYKAIYPELLKLEGLRLIKQAQASSLIQ